MAVPGLPDESEFADIQSLLAAVPEDPATALILADYLEEHHDPHRRLQGELLRLVYTLTRSVGGEDRTRDEERLRTLLRDSGVRAIGPYRRVMLDAEVALDFAWVPPGTFLMGSPEGEEGRDLEEDRRHPTLGEGPQHEVTLTRGFWMSITPVTQLQYARIVGHNPSWGSSRDADVDDEDRDLPVQEVTWYDALAFLRRLSTRVRGSGIQCSFRLPTEAEWEYACRAGTTTRFWSGDSEADLGRVAWYIDNSEVDGVVGMHPVGKGANPLGLFDMHGNVWEWCADRYDLDYYTRSLKQNPRCKRGESEERVVRGGDAWDDAASCRSAARDSNTAFCSHNDISFRVVADFLALGEVYQRQGTRDLALGNDQPPK